MLKKNSVIIFLFFLSLFLAFVISKVYLPQAYILWDEGNHIRATYDVYMSMATGDIPGVWNNIAKQAFYPPFQSIVMSPFLLLFGFSFYTIRLLTLLWFISGSFLLYYLGKKIIDERMGFLSSLLFLFSPMVIFLSFLFMKEMIGAVLSLFSVFLYILAREKKYHSEIYFVLTGLSLFCLFLTKYNYAGLIIGGIFLEGFYSLVFYKHRKKIFVSHFIILFCFIIPALLWLLIPVPFGGNRLSEFISFLQEQNTVTAGLTSFWGYLSFYPHAIITMYSPSFVIGYFLLFSFFAAIFYFKNYKIRVIWFCILLNYIFATTHSGNLQERYIFTTVPFLFLLGGLMGVKLFDKIRSIKSNSFYFGLLLGLLIIWGGKFTYDLTYLPHFIYGMAAHTVRSPIFHQTRVNEEVFNFDINTWDVPILSDFSDKPADVLNFITDTVDFKKPVQFIGFTNEFSPGYVETFFYETKKRRIFDYAKISPYSRYIVTVFYLPESGLRTADYLRMNSWQELEISKVQNNKSLVLINTKLFKDIGVEARVYGEL